MRRTRKARRKFVGNAECMGAVGWSVTYGKGFFKKGSKQEGNWDWDGEFGVSRDASSHYVTRKADLKPLMRMQKELADFIKECEIALKKVEEHNAKS
jgi:hypothetical protein